MHLCVHPFFYNGKPATFIKICCAQSAFNFLFWCAPIATNSEPCVFKTLIWSTVERRGISGTRFKCKDWAGGKLSAARLLSRAFMWKLRWSSEALFRIISWSKRARKRHRASAWHFSTPGSDNCTYHTYISQRGRLVQEECLWKGGDDEQAPDHGGL